MRTIFRKRILLPLLLGVGAAAVITPVLASPPKPPAPLLTRPVIANPVQPWSLALSQVIHSSPSGQLRGGCATMVGQKFCIPDVTVDGKPLSQVSILIDMLAAATRPTGIALPGSAQIIRTLSSSAVLQQAIANCVASEMLFAAATPSMRADSIVTGQSIAEQELQTYLKDPAAGEAADILPSGMSPQQYFLSPAMIGAFRDGAVIQNEEAALNASHVDVTIWVRQHFGAHVVRINGHAPGFSLSSVVSLP